MKYVVMLSTCTPGGMAQVVENFKRCGLFDVFSVRLLRTHDRGSIASRCWIFARAFMHFLCLLVTLRVSLVHAHVAMRGSFWRKSAFLWTARLFRCPTIVHLHGSQFEEFYEEELGTLRRALVRAVLRQAHAVVVLSEKWRAYLNQIEPGARIVIVHNFVDLQSIQASLDVPGCNRSADTILFLGELGRRKGIYELVRAMSAVTSKWPGARLVAGGTGELEQVKAAVRSAGMQEVVSLPGWVSGEEKLKLLATACVFALPSHNENFPVSILEAMAAGIPVVSTPVGGIPDMIRDGVEGYLVAPGNIDALANALVSILQDHDQRNAMGSAARRRVQARFSAAESISAIGTLYRECGASPGATHSTAMSRT